MLRVRVGGCPAKNRYEIIRREAISKQAESDTVQRLSPIKGNAVKPEEENIP